MTNGDMTWEYFTHEELACKGSGECNMDFDFMEKLIFLREAYNKPMYISSAYRSREHNEKVGGAPNSPHTLGKAVDILVSGKDAYRVIDLALKLGFTGIGVSQKGPHDKRFIHLDTMKNSPSSPRPTIWSY